MIWALEMMNKGHFKEVYDHLLAEEELSREEEILVDFCHKMKSYDQFFNDMIENKDSHYDLQSDDLFNQRVHQLNRYVLGINPKLTEQTKQIEEEKEKLFENDWVKSSFSALLQKLQGVFDFQEFGQIFLKYICHSIQAQVGSFYLFEDFLHSNDEAFLNFISRILLK